MIRDALLVGDFRARLLNGLMRRREVSKKHRSSCKVACSLAACKSYATVPKKRSLFRHCDLSMFGARQ